MSLSAVTAWKRFGHDRLYVRDLAGLPLGYWDNTTGQAVADDARRQGELVAAVQAHWAALRQTPRSGASTATGEPTATGVPRQRTPSSPNSAEPRWAPSPSWVDLAAPGRIPGRGGKNGARLGRWTGSCTRGVLDRLDERWKVVHAVPLRRGGGFDHVVTGPGGVFTVAVKEHPGARLLVQGDSFLVGRRTTRYVPVCRSEGGHAARLLTDAAGFNVLVTAVIVVGSARLLDVDSQPADGDVVVLARRRLARWLTSRPAVFDAAQVEAIFARARRSDVWAPAHRAPAVATDVS